MVYLCCHSYGNNIKKNVKNNIFLFKSGHTNELCCNVATLLVAIITKGRERTLGCKLDWLSYMLAQKLWVTLDLYQFIAHCLIP